MLGLWGHAATTYLLVMGCLTTLIFVIPIFFTPLLWGRIMLWKIPEDTDLAVYFGRCLGAFALVTEGLIFHAALTSSDLALTFDFLTGLFVMMVVIHIHGAIKHIQPITETLEIGLWIGLTLANLAFYPVAG